MSKTGEILSDLVFCPVCGDKNHGYREARTDPKFSIYCETCGLRGPSAETLTAAARAWDEGAQKIFTANLGKQYATLAIFPFYGPPIITTDFSLVRSPGVKDRIEVDVDGVTEQRLSSLEMFDNGHSVYGTISDSARTIKAFVAELVYSELLVMGAPEDKSTDVWRLKFDVTKQTTYVLGQGGTDADMVE